MRLFFGRNPETKAWFWRLRWRLAMDTVCWFLSTIDLPCEIDDDDDDGGGGGGGGAGAL